VAPVRQSRAVGNDVGKELVAGRKYRRRDLHDAGLGGNRQKGASYPAGGSHVLLFSGGTGHSSYGYDDHWIGDDRLQFFGEWSGPGDMTMTGGNAMIVERSPNLWVFFERSDGVHEFQGAFRYESRTSVAMKRDGRPATAIVFTLYKVADRVDL
jgi:hypothetical protein